MTNHLEHFANGETVSAAAPAEVEGVQDLCGASRMWLKRPKAFSFCPGGRRCVFTEDEKDVEVKHKDRKMIDQLPFSGYLLVPS